MLSLKKTIACLALCSGLPACAAFPAVLTNKLGASCAVARMSGIGALRWEPLLMATCPPPGWPPWTTSTWRRAPR